MTDQLEVLKDVAGVEHTDRGTYIGTYPSCGRFYPFDPRPEEMHIEDIAHALSNTCRFNGHISRFYSVAEHSVHMADQLSDKGKNTQRWALLHDATEAYIGDMVRPLKHSSVLEAFRDTEDVIHICVAKKFGLSITIPKLVHEMDNVMCSTERRDLIYGTAPWKSMPPPLARDRFEIPSRDIYPKEAKAMFLRKFYELWPV